MKAQLFLFTLLSLLVFTSCQEDDQLVSPAPRAEAAENADPFIHDDEENGLTAIGELTFDHEHESLIEHTRDFSEDYTNAEKVEVTRPDGTVETLYLIGGDIELTKEQLKKAQSMDDAELKQYRTYNTVSKNYIRVRGVSSGGSALTPKMQTALRWAINNYNALNTNKTFVLTFGAYPFWGIGHDIIVYQETSNPSAGGRAGFPYDSGNPYKFVRIYAGMENYSYNTNEHVMTHEIGHCMGLRHSDWYNRISCGSINPENANPYGAVWVPGTPWVADPNSVMEACFSSTEDGEFGYYDRVALEWMY